MSCGQGANAGAGAGRAYVGGFGSGVRQALPTMRVVVKIQSLGNGARSTPPVQMRCECKLGNCAQEPKAEGRAPQLWQTALPLFIHTSGAWPRFHKLYPAVSSERSFRFRQRYR
eukprot:4601255-Pleurochrysis_carterae.AAC.1